MMRILLFFCLLLVAGCDGSTNSPSTNGTPESFAESAVLPANQQPTLLAARQGFTTTIVKTGDSHGPPDAPTGTEFQLIQYPSPVGSLAAYITPDPGDNQQHPAIIWITGGDNNSIGDVWSPRDRENDQSVSGFRNAGLVLMFPSQRGGNSNPGKREGFYGEVDDVLAATDYLEQLPYVDANQIYLGGHSTGGTLVMLIGACTDRYRGIFSLGPIAAVSQYGGDYVYCNPHDENEIRLRSPIYWMHCVKNPMYVLEGESGNWDGAIDLMAEQNTNSNIQFYRISGHDHFTVIAPVVELLAQQILEGQVDLSPQLLEGLR